MSNYYITAQTMFEFSPPGLSSGLVYKLGKKIQSPLFYSPGFCFKTVTFRSKMNLRDLKSNLSLKSQRVHNLYGFEKHSL